MSDELTNHQVSADIWKQYSLTLDGGNIPCPMAGGNPLTKYGQRWESLCPNME